MPDVLYVDSQVMEDYAKKIEDAKNAFSAQNLTAPDSKTTLTANQSGQDIIQEEQNIMNAFLEQLTKDIANLRSLNQEFQEFDEAVGSANAGS